MMIIDIDLVMKDTNVAHLTKDHSKFSSKERRNTMKSGLNEFFVAETSFSLACHGSFLIIRKKFLMEDSDVETSFQLIFELISFS